MRFAIPNLNGSAKRTKIRRCPLLAHNKIAEEFYGSLFGCFYPAYPSVTNRPMNYAFRYLNVFIIKISAIGLARRVGLFKGYSAMVSFFPFSFFFPSQQALLQSTLSRNSLASSKLRFVGWRHNRVDNRLQNNRAVFERKAWSECRNVLRTRARISFKAESSSFIFA